MTVLSDLYKRCLHCSSYTLLSRLRKYFGIRKADFILVRMWINKARTPTCSDVTRKATPTSSIGNDIFNA